MKNLMDEYIDFTSKKVKKYVKMVLRMRYNDDIVQEFLKTYINSRYYNINDDTSRAFYLKITDALNRKQELMEYKYGENADVKLIDSVKQIFVYMLFFDNVRKVENFKNIESIREIIVQMLNYVQNNLELKIPESLEDELYNEITDDLLEKDIYLDNFETDSFYLDFEKDKTIDTIYYTKLAHNIKIPMQFSDAAVEKVYNTGLVAEDKLEVEYILLSVVAIRDILNGNFKDTYVAEFSNTLFKKAQKLEGLLSILDNEALQDKIYINIQYEDLIKNKEQIQEFRNRGYNFTITLDDNVQEIEDVMKLKMFKLVIVPKNIKLYQEIMKHKSQLSNVIDK